MGGHTHNASLQSPSRILSASKAQTMKVRAIHTKKRSPVPAVSAVVQNGIFASRCAHLATYPPGVSSALHKRAGHFPNEC